MDSCAGMIRAGFLDAETRQDLIELARNGSVEHRLARRANALILLDLGQSCEEVAINLLLDDDTIRTWHRLYEEDGLEGIIDFGYEGGACRLSLEQQEKLKLWVAQTLPRTTRQIGAWIEQEFEIAYQGRSGLIALMRRIGMVYRKPKTVSRKLNVEKQKAFIEAYNALLNGLSDDEAVLPRSTPQNVPVVDGSKRTSREQDIFLLTHLSFRSKSRAWVTVYNSETAEALNSVGGLAVIHSLYEPHEPPPPSAARTFPRT